MKITLLALLIALPNAHAAGQSAFCRNYDESQLQEQAQREHQQLQESQQVHRRTAELHQWTSREKALLQQAQQDRKQMCKIAKEVAEEVKAYMDEHKPSAEGCKSYEDMEKLLTPPYKKLRNGAWTMHDAYIQLSEQDSELMQEHKSSVQKLQGKPGVDVQGAAQEMRNFYYHGKGNIMRPIMEGMQEEIERLDKEAKKLDEIMRKVKRNQINCKMKEIDAARGDDKPVAKPVTKPAPKRR